MTEQRDITRESCPEKPRLSHHLKPKREGRATVLACAYCGKTSAEIRAAAPTPTVDLTFTDLRRPAPQHHRRNR